MSNDIKKKAVDIIVNNLTAISGALLEIANQLPNLLVEELIEETVTLAEVNTDNVSNQPTETVEVPAEEVEVEEKEEVISREELEAKKYNELRALASELGLDSKGKKIELIDRILEYYENQGKVKEVKEVKEVEEEVIEEAEESDEEISDEEAEYRRLEQMLEEYTNEELADILVQVGKSPKGKRQALITKVIDAIKEGLIGFEDDDEEETDEVEVEEVYEEEKEEEQEEELLVIDDEDEEIMTDARREAVVELTKKIKDQYKKGELTDKEMKKFLEEYFEHIEGEENCVECTCPNDDRLSCYIKVQTSLIDDDGMYHDFEEPYVVNDEYYCCGKPLIELSEGTLYCQVCGQEYEE